MNHFIHCTNCGQLYPQDKTPHICECGGIFDFSEFPNYSQASMDPDQPGMWKYASMFGLADNAPIVTLGEGDTPLINGTFNGHPVYYKMESLNPTGSYKDRGTAVLVSFLRSRGITAAVEDSSGNAGASFAAYAAKTEMKAHIYAPESTSGPKRTQIEMFGADLIRIPGPRAEAAKAVLAAVSKGAVYASHAYMPFGLPGIATIAYEIVDSLGGAAKTVLAPVGHGGLLYGIILGFEALLKAGVITDLPYFVGVQPENCSPLVRAFQDRDKKADNPVIRPTIAEGTSVTNPVRGSAILRKLKHGRGTLVSATEMEIGKTYQMLAKQGIYCEPTSALSLTPLLNDKIEFNEPVVSVLTGSGFKTNVKIL